MTSWLLWNKVKDELVPSPQGLTIFDDPVDKNFLYGIELARRQWSGHPKTVIKGIALVATIYVNLELNYF